jgi:hypothetical protein
VAVHVSIHPGYDASYPWRQIGTGQETPTSPLEYYLTPADKGGEPPGLWMGRGLATLGFAPGQVIDREVFEQLFGQHLDPRDPAQQERLGRAAQQFASEDGIYAELVAAEPHATPARQAELRTLARAQTRRPVPFWDVTLSVSKSVSLFHGSLLARADHARKAGDLGKVREWEQSAARVWEDILEADRAMLDYLQDEAGYTRTGYHRGSDTESRAELGKWEAARNWVVGVFRQHVSRDGDPQLHGHNLVLNKVETERDGKWRKLDSRGLYRQRRAAAAVGAVTLERLLTRDFGLVWVQRADGNGKEIKGVSQEDMDLYSSRRRTITFQARQVAEQRAREWGRAPDARQMDRIQRDITQRTRKGKDNGPLDIAALLRDWEDRAAAADLGTLESVYDKVMAEARGVREREQSADRLARQVGAELAGRWERALSEAERADVDGFVTWVTRRGELAGPFDVAALARGFEEQQRADAERERQIRRVTGRALAQAQAQAAARTREQAQARGYTVAYPVDGARGLTEAEVLQVMGEALACVQGKLTKWHRADLIAVLAERLPAHVHADRATLEALAARALSGGSREQVALLSAPEWPRVPGSLRRADGESVFRPHGAELYATQAQLTLEERLVAQAQEPAGPRLDPDTAARLLGAERERLEAQLRPEPTTAAVLTETTGGGLRMDQAAAAYFLLTSARRVEVMIGPAGTGKTRTSTELARIWATAGLGPVVALTTSSNARNVIREEAARHGVTLQAYNTAEWLGHTETAREARTPVHLSAGSLIIVDEASMISIPDLAAVVRRAAEHGAKVFVTGDPTGQIQAVEGGGGMQMLARKLGHVQLSEAGRFRHAWESEASLRLREGDVTVLSEYRQHGRLHSGRAEGVLEDAARAYLHDRLTGQDTLLMAATEGMAVELSRRVRGDLIGWGLVSGGPSVMLRDGAEASAGDLVMARRNAKRVGQSRAGRGLINRDILRIVDPSAGPGGLSAEVVRLTGRDPVTGREHWSAPFLIGHMYLRAEAQLAYAVTFDAAEGRTVDSGIAVFTGEEGRQRVDVGLTRGRDRNEAYVITGWQLSDPAPGSRVAPELARQTRLDREQAGLAPSRASQQPDQQERGHEPVTAEEVLGTCLARDDQQMSATDTRDAEWSDADRLDVLGVQWDHVAREASQRRYEVALRRTLPDAQAREVIGDSAVTWLWRSLREAEAAGLDGAAVLRQAVASGTLADASSAAKVVDWRVRQQIAGMPALAARSWAEQVRPTGDPEMDRYWAELADAMADRQRRLGEHAAEYPPAWARSLGLLAEHPVDRADWEHKAGLVERYRERWGYTHPYDPIGPRPGQHSPHARADWQAAAEALGYTPGNLHEYSDGQLWAWQAMFAREMEWAPRYKGDDLARVRGEICRTQVEADRARRNAEAADSEEARQRLTDRAATLAQWEQMTRDLEARLTEAQAGYDAWENATGPTRERAVAASAELRRRHPYMNLQPPRAEPAQPRKERLDPPSDRETETGAALTATPAQPAIAEPAAGPAGPDLAPHADRMDQVARQLREISARLDEAALRKAHEARERAAAITSLHAEPEDPEASPVPAWKTELEARQRDAVRRDPMPRVPRAEAVAAEAQAGIDGPEAAN